MSSTDLIISVLTALLVLGAAVAGGIFVRHGTFKPAIEMMKDTIESYEQAHQLEGRTLAAEQGAHAAVKTELAREKAANAAYQARAAELNQLIANCILDREAWARERLAWANERDAWVRERAAWADEKLRLVRRIDDLEAQLRAVQAGPPPGA